MKRCKPLSLFAALLFYCWAATVSAETEMFIGLDRVTIYEGESFLYVVQVSDTAPIGEEVTPDMSTLADFHVRALPKQMQTTGGSTIRQVINGKVVRDETTPITYNAKFSYFLTPKRTGSLTIPAPKVVLAGKTLVPAALQVERQVIRDVPPDGAIPVTVRPPDEQDVAVLTIETDRSRLYPFQSLTVTLVVRIKEVEGRFAGRNPMSLLKNPPQLLIPWAENDASLPKGMVPERKLVDWLNSQLAPRGGQGTQGFAVNEHADERFGMGFDDDWFGAPFSSRRMFQKVPYQFGRSPEKVMRKDASGKEAAYWEYRFDRTFRPEELGEYAFGPVMLKGALPVSVPETRDGVDARSIYAITPAVTVQVVDVPEENRPESYIGAFGTFDWSVDLRPHEAKVGEPMTLTFRLTGQGSTAGVKAPDLSTIPGLADRFRLYPPTEEVDDRSCAFTYTIRPTQAGAVEFPSIPVSFFDVDREEFVTRRSDPIPLVVTEAPTLHSSPGFIAERRAPTGDLELSEKGIFANMTDPAGAVDQSVDFRSWAGSLVSIVAVYLVLLFGTVVRRRIGNDPKRRRRRSAPGRARQRLHEVKGRLNDRAGEPAAALGAELQTVFFGFVADLTDGTAEGMTTKDACRKLLELGVDSQTVGRVRGLLETLDGARYGALDLRSLDDLAETADRLLKETVTALKQNGSATKP